MFYIRKRVMKRNNFTARMLMLAAILVMVLSFPAPVHGDTQDVKPYLGGGLKYSAFLKSDGSVWAWGANSSGQLGDGTNLNRFIPVRVQFPQDTTITALSVGRWHMVAVDSDGKVWAWGSNPCGQLGDGTKENRNVPTLVQGLEGKTIVAVAAGGYHSVALDSTGSLWAWGYNKQGQLGLGFVSDAGSVMPQAVAMDEMGTRKAVAIAASKYHTAVLADDGTAWTCGRTDYRILGRDTTTVPQSKLGQVQGLDGIVFEEIAIGTEHMAARDSSGAVYVWGGSSEGQMGDGTTGNNNLPAAVSALAGKTIIAVVADDCHTAAVDNEGKLWTWGRNQCGQLGNGISGDGERSLTPGVVPGLDGVTVIGAGYDHMLALKDDGGLWTWGDNSTGQLGDNSTNASSVPVRIDASLSADRPLREDTLNGAELMVDIHLDSFNNSLTPGQFALQNAPNGLGVSDVQYIGQSQCAITLSFDGTDYDTNFNEFGVGIAASALQGNQTISLDALEITATDEPRVISDQPLTESNLNGCTLTVGLQTGTFADGLLDVGSFTFSHAPAGLSVATAQAISTTQCALDLLFDGTDFDSNISNLTITIAGCELSDGNPQTTDRIAVAAVREDHAGTHSSGGGGSSSSASSAYQVEVRTGDHSAMTLPLVVDKNARKAFIDVASENFSRGGIEITVPATPDIETYTVGIPASNLSTPGDQSRLTLNTEIGSVSAPSNMLSGIEKINGNQAEISIGRGDKGNLPENVKAAIGDRPLVQLTLSLDGKQADWSNPDAPVTVSLPYQPTEEELTHPESIVVWYIDGSGNVVSIPNGHYDPETKSVLFEASHFSDYAVAYQSVSFHDIPSNAWYRKAVDFIAARNITSGTGEGTYSPKNNMTRSEFLVMVMKAYDLTPDINPVDNFSDAGNTYYTGYLAAAKRLGISAGIGDNQFAPRKEVTRQEMSVLLYNALKVIGQLPSADSGKSLSEFHDAGQISDWAKEAMTSLVESEIISGNAGNLSPKATTTRAEMAQVLYNLLSR